MHTEHLQSVRPGRVALAWLLGASVACAIVFVALALNLVESESTTANRLELSAIAIGSFTAGLYAGMRAGEAPILHGIAIALFSMVVWFVFNVLATTLFSGASWVALTPNFTVAVMMIQVVAAVVGARFGYRRFRRAA